jgi:hypothetical protein
MIRRAVALSLFVLLGACATRQPPDHVALPPAPPPGEPLNLLGTTDAALRTTYGPPAFVRRDGGIELWRYNGAACEAFFFLYPDHGTLTVQHIETLPRPVNAAADPICLQSLHSVPAPVS